MGGAKTGSTLSGNQKLVDAQISKYLQDKIGQPAQSYNGQLVANLLPQYDTGLKQLNQYNPNYLMGQQTSALTQALSGKSAANLDPAATAKYYDQAVGKPLMKTYNKYIAPGINEAYGSQGAFLSSRRSQALAQGLQTQMDTYSSGLAQAQLQNQQLNAQYQESAANRAFQAVPIAASMRAAPLQNSLMYSQALAPYQQNAQQQLDAQYNEFIRTRPESSPWLAAGLNYIGQNQLYQQNKPSPALGALGGAASGAAMGAAAGPWGALIGAGVGAVAGGVSAQ